MREAPGYEIRCNRKLDVSYVLMFLCFHQSIFISFCRVAGERMTAAMGHRWDTAWASNQSMTGLTQKDRQLLKLTFTPPTNLELTINLT